MILSKRIQLFVLHFAGGSVYSFDFLKKHMDSNIEFIALELPGRGKRIREKFITDKQAGVKDYFEQINKLRNGAPYLIYGHSMGATLGLSVVSKLEEIGDTPEALVVSGNPGPGIKEENTITRYLLNDDDFKAELRRLGGVSEEVLDNEELYNFYSPIMRADFELLEKDNFSEKGIKLKAPIYALMGDEEESKDKIENWNNFTIGGLTKRILSGNHFFIMDNSVELATIIKRMAGKKAVKYSTE